MHVLGKAVPELWNAPSPVSASRRGIPATIPTRYCVRSLASWALWSWISRILASAETRSRGSAVPFGSSTSAAAAYLIDSAALLAASFGGGP